MTTSPKRNAAQQPKGEQSMAWMSDDRAHMFASTSGRLLKIVHVDAEAVTCLVEDKLHGEPCTKRYSLSFFCELLARGEITVLRYEPVRMYQKPF